MTFCQSLPLCSRHTCNVKLKSSIKTLFLIETKWKSEALSKWLCHEIFNQNLSRESCKITRDDETKNVPLARKKEGKGSRSTNGYVVVVVEKPREWVRS